MPTLLLKKRSDGLTYPRVPWCLCIPLCRDAGASNWGRCKADPRSTEKVPPCTSLPIPNGIYIASLPGSKMPGKSTVYDANLNRDVVECYVDDWFYFSSLYEDHATKEVFLQRGLRQSLGSRRLFSLWKTESGNVLLSIEKFHFSSLVLRWLSLHVSQVARILKEKRH